MTDEKETSRPGVAQPSQVTTAEDPTEAIMSKSALSQKYLCDYVVNVATGCRHECKFCYVASSPNITARGDMLENTLGVEDGEAEWGSYVAYRDGLGDRLAEHLSRKQTWETTRGGQGIVGVSYSTDCYQDGRAGAITRRVVEALTNHDRYVRVQTRNPILALQDLPTFRAAGGYVTVGTSLPSLDGDKVGAIERGAPHPEHRLRGLKEFNKHGVTTFVSMSPTYPTASREDIRTLLEQIKECDPSAVFHEPINPRGDNFDRTVEAARNAGAEELATELEKLKHEKRWVQYATTHLRWVQELSEELDIPIHLWPDKQLVRTTTGATSDWLQAWRERQSVESFAGRPDPENQMPEPTTQATLSATSG